MQAMGCNTKAHFEAETEHRLFWTIYSRHIFWQRSWRIKLTDEEQAEADRIVGHLYDDYVPCVFANEEPMMR
jgi:hypothetical protein